MPEREGGREAEGKGEGEGGGGVEARERERDAPLCILIYLFPCGLEGPPDGPGNAEDNTLNTQHDHITHIDFDNTI